jgi:hypothetical protein
LFGPRAGARCHSRHDECCGCDTTDGADRAAIAHEIAFRFTASREKYEGRPLGRRSDRAGAPKWGCGDRLGVPEELREEDLLEVRGIGRLDRRQ